LLIELNLSSGFVGNDAVYVGARRAGLLVCALWHDGTDAARMLASLLESQGAAIDLLEVAFTSDYRVEPSIWSLAPEQRGRRGVALALDEAVERWAPSQMVAANIGFIQVLHAFCTKHGVTPADFSMRGRVTSFAARTLLIPLDGRPAIELYRGGVLVEGPVTPDLVETMAQGMAAWLVNNTCPDGRIPYKYWPSSESYSMANNTIRQFMATVCLGRIAASLGGVASTAARRNLTYNLETFLELRGELGMIAYDGTAKLGATALAALAILEREGTAGPHAMTFAALARGVQSLWQPDGAFKSFHYPVERRDHQNFYPGEALLFWATLWRDTANSALLRQFMTSFRYYRHWHRANPNPAFIPWHTQAYAIVYQSTGDAELLTFIFEMNDWLLCFQQGDEVEHLDLVGRFYDPDQPELGPPHASSTGVYLESLATAFAMARTARDDRRADAYAAAIRAGIRNLRHLQFKDDADLFYIGRRERVAGAVRTNAYDNSIRVDNVQHGLMALLGLVATRLHLACCPGVSTSQTR
jgi:hypothetical protein